MFDPLSILVNFYAILAAVEEVVPYAPYHSQYLLYVGFRWRTDRRLPCDSPASVVSEQDLFARWAFKKVVARLSKAVAAVDREAFTQ
jgi:hypothetical protein